MWFGPGGFRRPLLAVLAFAIACGWTYGAAALLVGRRGRAVGRRLAHRHDALFVDLDESIEKAAGKPIPQIFADDGEGLRWTGELPPRPERFALAGRDLREILG